MKIAYISTYLPRKCGIATFTNNLIKSVAANLDVNSLEEHATVVAMNEDDQYHSYPDEVKYIIRQNHQRDYLNAAKFINLSNCQLCVLQHEFGIFGGDSGVYILPLVSRLEVPLIVTLHTVLKEPSFTQKAVIQELARHAQKLVVMSRRAVNFLVNIYDVPEEKVALIEHGVPDLGADHETRQSLKESFRLTGRKVMMTFGLLSRNKGIETVIEALPQVVERHPEITYLVLGNTHPEVLRNQGEEYRNYLIRLVNKYGLQDNVQFLKTFLSEDKIFEYLAATDVYITPYLNEAQITSGTLSYAVGAGAAVVSTPYWHAQELLDDGRGILFDFRNSQQLADILNGLFDSGGQLQEIKERAYGYGQQFRWKKIGSRYLALARESLAPSPVKVAKKGIVDTAAMPSLKLKHAVLMTDETGIVQHAKYGIPNLKEGYCIDDNSRALIMVLMAYKQNKSPDALRLIPIYASFVHYMQNEDGTFRNFLSFDRKYLDERGTQDAYGRTMWALGYFVFSAPNEGYRALGRDLFHSSLGQLDNLDSVRGIANSVIGLSYYCKAHPSDDGMLRILDKQGQRLLQFFNDYATEEWMWFEETLTYDNGILPLALFHLAERTGNNEYLEAALKATEFLTAVSFRQGYLTPVGNMGWYCRGGDCPMFAQQAVDAMAMVLLYFQAYLVTRESEFISRMYQSYMWFLGENELRLPLYDHETAGCHDGLEPYGLNLNQGAESTLAFLISHLTVLQALELEYEYTEKAEKTEKDPAGYLSVTA